MILKNLKIASQDQWGNYPEKAHLFNAEVEFRNSNGHEIKIVLTQEQVAGVLGIVSDAIVAAATEGAKALIASTLAPVNHKQIEASNGNSEESNIKVS